MSLQTAKRLKRVSRDVISTMENASGGLTMREIFKEIRNKPKSQFSFIALTLFHLQRKNVIQESEGKFKLINKTGGVNDE